MANRDFPSQRRIKDEARCAARDGLTWPPPIYLEMKSCTDLDLAEVEATHGAAMAEARRTFEKAERELPTEASLKLAVEPARAGLTMNLASVRAAARRVLVAEREEEAEFLTFCRGNKLTRRIARFPQGSRTLYWVAPAMLTGSAELLANVGIVGPHLTGGLVDAFSIALCVSLANLSVAAAGAEFGRDINHREGSRKIRGWVGATVFAFGLFVLHLYYAHFRTAVGEGADTGAAVLLHRVFSTPLNLSFPGLLLLVLGLSAGCFIWARRLQSDDPYPGFGKAYRSLLGARGEADAVRSSLTELRRAAVSKAHDLCAKRFASAEPEFDTMRRTLGRIEAADVSADLQMQAALARLAEGHQVFTDEYAVFKGQDLPPNPCKTTAVARPRITLGGVAEYSLRLRVARERVEKLHLKQQEIERGLDVWAGGVIERFLKEIEESANALHASQGHPGSWHFAAPDDMEVVR